MAGNDYRRGRKQVNVLLSLALHGQVRLAASTAGLSMSEWLVEAIREKVSRDAEGTAAGSGPGSGRPAVADGRRSGFDPQRTGSGTAGVVAGGFTGPLTEHDPLPESPAGPWPALTVVEYGTARLVRNDPFAAPLVGAVNEPLPFDLFADDSKPAEHDTRGRILSPVVRDEWIDTA